MSEIVRNLSSAPASVSPKPPVALARGTNHGPRRSRRRSHRRGGARAWRYDRRGSTCDAACAEQIHRRLSFRSSGLRRLNAGGRGKLFRADCRPHLGQAGRPARRNRDARRFVPTTKTKCRPAAQSKFRTFPPRAFWSWRMRWRNQCRSRATKPSSAASSTRSSPSPRSSRAPAGRREIAGPC